MPFHSILKSIAFWSVVCQGLLLWIDPTVHYDVRSTHYVGLLYIFLGCKPFTDTHY
jgi:hypothetical protein